MTSASFSWAARWSASAWSTPGAAGVARFAASRAASASAKAQALEEQLAGALHRAADAEAAHEAAKRTASAAPGVDQAEALQRAAQEKDALITQVAERDQKISRLQREVTDKTERLGRLAKEMGELKAKRGGFFG